MSVIKKIFIGVGVLIVLVVGAAAIAIKTVDINQYRDRIADALSNQIGRMVKFGGPIHLALDTHGIGIAVENASIGNPPWASRPQMASIGKLELGVALLPLVNRQLVITELDVRDADIQLETNANNQNNWELKPAAPETTSPASHAGLSAAPASPSPAAAVGVRVNELSIVNSKLAMRDKDGKISTFKVNNMSLAPEGGHSTVISLDADYDGAPIKLSLKAGTPDLIADSKWTYESDLTYAGFHLHAQGNADVAGKSVELNPYEFKAGNSNLHGQLMVNAGGAKTDVRGSIMGDKLDTADLKLPSDNSAAPAVAPANANAPEPAPANNGEKSGPLFSSAPLNLSALKSTNAAIDIAIDEVDEGKNVLKQVNGKLDLANGNLVLSPFKATMGTSALEGDVKLDANASPAQYSVSFKAPGVDVANLLETIGAPAFMTGGKGDADIELSGSGNSLHEMAGTAQGHIDITATGGTISGAAANGIASSLAQILAPGTANPALNCVVVRFNVANGVGKDNGILADSSASTVAGSGGFDLGKETVDLTLNAKPKLINTGGLLPAVLISGPLADPKIGINAVGEAQNVAGTLLKNRMGGTLGNILGNNAGGNSANAVPVMQNAPDGQNSCVYSLDHKAEAPAQAATTPSQNKKSGIKNVIGNPTGGVKNLGNQLMQGILGH